MSVLEKRNFYRLLNVQPDASQELIRSCYQSMLQKLRLHPDLGGNNEQASLINEAYNVLRNPQRRSAYDLRLLGKYGIEALSGCPYGRSSSSTHTGNKQVSDRLGNKRNYYRILNIQPEAPGAIISNAYKTQLRLSDYSAELLADAYQVLMNERQRAMYDCLLQQHYHGEAAKRLFMPPGDTNKTSVVTKANPEQRPASNRSRLHGYQQTAKIRCLFCGTSQIYVPSRDYPTLCVTCNSPLIETTLSPAGDTGRGLERVRLKGRVDFYLKWPGGACRGDILDISPTGMKFNSASKLRSNQIVKIDSDQFQAVGKVMYSDNNAGLCTAGIHFLAVHFNTRQGTFIKQTI